MWTRTEISELAQTLNAFQLEEILNDSELEAIPSTAIPNLRSHLFEPKHNRNVSDFLDSLDIKPLKEKTITLQNICKELDMYAWLNEITSKLRLADIFLWVGFSFLMRKTTEEGEELKYMFAARELAYERTKAFNEEGLAEFVDRFKTKTEADILQGLFKNKEANADSISGFQPYKLVSAYVWIR